MSLLTCGLHGWCGFSLFSVVLVVWFVTCGFCCLFWFVYDVCFDLLAEFVCLWLCWVLCMVWYWFGIGLVLYWLLVVVGAAVVLV